MQKNTTIQYVRELMNITFSADNASVQTLLISCAFTCQIKTTESNSLHIATLGNDHSIYYDLSNQLEFRKVHVFTGFH